MVDSKKFEAFFCLFEESNCSPAFLKVSVYSTKIAAVVLFDKKSVALNAPKHLPLSHSFMVNVMIRQFHKIKCSYPLNIVNFL